MTFVDNGSSGVPLPDGELVTAAPPKGAIAGTRYSVKALYAHRELLGLLVRREIKSRYKDSSLGLVWSLLRPLTMLLIYYVAIGKFLGAERSIPQFAIFVFTGLTAWGLFSDIISSSTSSIVANSGLIKKVYLPREIFPLATVGSAGFNFLVQFAILLLATIALGQAPLSPSLWLLPLSLVALLLVAFSVGLLLSALNVYLRDVQHLVEVLLLVMFWASPIVYSYQFVHSALGGGWLEQLYLANPFTPIVLGFQKSMWLAGAEQLWPPYLELRLAVVCLVSLAFLWLAQRIFAKLEGNFAQEL
ncbi:ABC transporter permease [Salinibacterium sp. ZJ454]|uniref:ABC transporter permease n=1 Tax=Salinibacterium sp. ZJ454 TaxID=2708339 RepID=UPI001424593E|nr:ABC transporter permease [Salinibacterium sp. ZJ454]